MNILNIVANNIKHYRQHNKLSQEQLAEKCGLHRTYIGSVERGERNISIKNIDKVAKALGIKPYKLLIGK